MDGKDILLNYSEVALGLLDRYRRGLKDALHSNNIDPNATEYVAQRFQVSSGLHFSLQPEYRRSDTRSGSTARSVIYLPRWAMH